MGFTWPYIERTEDAAASLRHKEVEEKIRQALHRDVKARENGEDEENLALSKEVHQLKYDVEGKDASFISVLKVEELEYDKLVELRAMEIHRLNKLLEEHEKIKSHYEERLKTKREQIQKGIELLRS